MGVREEGAQRGERGAVLGQRQTHVTLKQWTCDTTRVSDPNTTGEQTCLNSVSVLIV